MYVCMYVYVCMYICIMYMCNDNMYICICIMFGPMSINYYYVCRAYVCV